MKALKKKLANFAKIEKLSRIYYFFIAITKTTLNAYKYRKNKKNNKFRNNSDFLKRKVKKVIWKPAKFAKIAKVTRIFFRHHQQQQNTLTNIARIMGIN